jgi:hypothetical protein
MFMTDPEEVLFHEQPSSSGSYLVSRVQEEAAAAADATSIETTLIHLKLATAYAQRLSEEVAGLPHPRAQSWADEHRIW